MYNVCIYITLLYVRDLMAEHDEIYLHKYQTHIVVPIAL